MMFQPDWRDRFLASPYRLRFELGGEEFPNVERPVPRFLRAFGRAQALADEVLSKADVCHALIADWSGEGFQQLSAMGFRAPAPVASWSAAPYPDDSESPPAEWQAFELTGDPTERNTLIWASITQEMPIEPVAGLLIYFVVQTPAICFHVYDDRGLDVTALSPSDLNELRSDYDDWILDYDRKRIAKAFG